MTLALARLEASALQSGVDSVRDHALNASPHDRPRVAQGIRAALHAGLVNEAEVRAALGADRPGVALAALGSSVLRRFARKLPRLPKLDPSVRLSAGADWISDPTIRHAIRGWLLAFVDWKALSTKEVRGAIAQGDARVLELLTDGWRCLVARIADEVNRAVGPTLNGPLHCYVSPAVLEGQAGLDSCTGVAIETPDVIHCTLEHLNAYAKDDRLPLLMAALTGLARSVRCLEIVAPNDILNGDLMYCEWMLAIQYHMEDGLQTDGAFQVPEALAEQLEAEFGMEVDGNDALRARIERLMAYYADKGVLTEAKLRGKPLRRALEVAARRGGRLGSVLDTFAKALTYLDTHCTGGAHIRFSADDECLSPAVVFAGTTTGFEEAALDYRFGSAMESGLTYAHIVDSETRATDAALLAVRETCCISAVIRSLATLNGKR